MESRTHCAYNQTRECFLGLEVKAADLPSTRVGELMSERPLKSGEGVWMTPFRGIPAAAMPAPLDLIYLDEDCRVIDTVESFPTFQVSSSKPKPDSVLALPAHSIYSSQTQAGDQLVLCVAEEMGRQLQRLDNPSSETGAVPSIASAVIAGAVLLREKPLWSGGPGLLELENRNGHGDKAAPETYEMDLSQPGAKAFKQRSWLQRWWSPDPRKAPRVPTPGLAAYYWNGSSPAAHGIRDISSTGLYVVTEERWYPGTLVLMTLQRNDLGEEVAERSIAVQSRAVRWGPDGVGLQFVLPDERDRRRGEAPILDSVDRKEFERFLEQLKRAK
ncbi:MAG: PilZ domain-containing protein [Terracidiphilus sp.]